MSKLADNSKPGSSTGGGAYLGRRRARRRRHGRPGIPGSTRGAWWHVQSVEWIIIVFVLALPLVVVDFMDKQNNRGGFFFAPYFFCTRFPAPLFLFWVKCIYFLFPHRGTSGRRVD